MKRLKVLLDFIKLSVVEKINFYNNVIDKMTNNPKFTTPDVPLADLRTKVDQFEAAQLEAIDGGRVAKVKMRQIELEADELFRKQADYVNRIANGDEATILSSGFHCSKEPAPRQVPEFSVKEGEKPGTVIVKRQAFPGAKSYIWQIFKGESSTPTDEWTVAGVSSQASFEITGLDSVSRYWFRVAVVTPEGTGSFGPAISKVIQ